MANFLTKLFRRKGHHHGDEKKTRKKRGAKHKHKSITDKDNAKPSPLQPRNENEDPLNRTPTATTASDRGSNASRQQQKGVLSPHSQQEMSKQPKRRSDRGPIDLDDHDMEEVSDENRDRSNLSPRLSFQQLQQFNRQQPTSPNAHHLYVHSPTNDHRNGGSLTNAQAQAMENMANGSDCSSSDFNLSTDAEDTEYNNLRRRGGAPYALNTSNLDTSGMSAMSSPTNYTTDDDNAIFPALQTDDEATTPKEEPAAPDDEPQPQPIEIVPMAHETEDDMRAWTTSPTMQLSSSTPKASDNPASPKFNAFSNGAANNVFSNGTANKNKDTPKVVEIERQQDLTDTFGNFANFDDFPMVEQPKSESRPRPSTRAFLVDTPDRSPDSFANQRRKASSSASAAHPETSLSDLLAQAKRKSSRKKSSSSVNSAPVITSQYLREHHKLGRSSNGDSRSVDKTTSVTDIIQSLEATNAARLKSSRSGSRSHRSRDHDTHSHASNGGSTTRSAKERIREKRRKERNRIGSDDSDNEEAQSESWLFDEVAGALGPRGVAADMESLGGRSNRSKNSSGNKSHRSHRSHKSHRSHRSSRRKKSSNESVDSRNSRSSRYSHRSTRSYLSQMSEQSRSVANDLLRLEMQLAMVGSQEVSADDGKGSVTGSTGGASRASRASRTSRQSSSNRRSSSSHHHHVSKRSKMTVVAPPGKLGIILANKADSKGTVVSGVRTSSVLAEKISPGDRIIAIDGEDVSLMTVSEITTIMARKSDFERQLTVMTTPKHLGLQNSYAKESDAYYRR